MTSDGSPYTRLKLALRNGNLLAVRASAAELGRIDLPDALDILNLIMQREADRFDSAAVRWAGRLALERKGLNLLELGTPFGRWANCPTQEPGNCCSRSPIHAGTVGGIRRQTRRAARRLLSRALPGLAQRAAAPAARQDRC